MKIDEDVLSVGRIEYQVVLFSEHNSLETSGGQLELEVMFQQILRWLKIDGQTSNDLN